MISKTQVKPDSIEAVLNRYPRLSAHMICESLGYFTPASAANAILHHIRGRPFYCEWYWDMAGEDVGADNILRIGLQVIEKAFRERRHHQGFMAHYPAARALVEHVRGGNEEPIFMSW